MSSTHLGVISSTGTISVYVFQTETHLLTHIGTHQVFSTDLLVLSFSWCPPLSSIESLLVATLSNGAVHLARFSSDFKSLELLNNKAPVNAHAFEAWTCALSFPRSPSNSIRIFTGGDDAHLRLATLDVYPNIESDQEIPIVLEIIQSKFKDHEAGVTAVLPLPPSDLIQEIVLAGSYDDCIRIYTIPFPHPHGPKTSCKLLASRNLGGGVWRLKLLSAPTYSEGVKLRVLASCMHAGARILEITMTEDEDEGEWRIDILGEVTVHESMCYGCDVQPLPTDGVGVDLIEDMEWEKVRTCVSTSFYDSLVCVWRFDPRATHHV